MTTPTILGNEVHVPKALTAKEEARQRTQVLERVLAKIQDINALLREKQ